MNTFRQKARCLKCEATNKLNLDYSTSYNECFHAKLEPLDHSGGSNIQVCVTQLCLLWMGWIQLSPPGSLQGVLMYIAEVVPSPGHLFLAATSL